MGKVIPIAALPTAAIVPVAPNDCRVANVEPAATLPIDDCQAAAAEPLVIPVVAKPANVSPAVAAKVPAPKTEVIPNPVAINL